MCCALHYVTGGLGKLHHTFLFRAFDGSVWWGSQSGHFRPMETASGTHWTGG
jgi:hypothetical protein